VHPEWAEGQPHNGNRLLVLASINTCWGRCRLRTISLAFFRDNTQINSIMLSVTPIPEP
jgi:hypothetical protein